MTLGKVEEAPAPAAGSGWLRWLMPIGWLLAAVGYYGPWVAHKTAALTLSGIDIGEFVKFLPGAGSEAVRAVRLMFYLPPVAVAVSIALLVGSRRLRYPGALRLLALLLAVPVSLQLLPPAWSLASLTAADFRIQLIALAACWTFLATFWLWRHLPFGLTTLLAGTLALLAGSLAAWEFLGAQPAIAVVYGTILRIGWGFFACVGGLALLGVSAIFMSLASLASSARRLYRR